jgi:hypothetical protein
MKKLQLLGLTALLGTTEPGFATDWFYGQPVPTVTGAVASNEWIDCISKAAGRLDDHSSPVMDVALALEPICATKENNDDRSDQ